MRRAIWILKPNRRTRLRHRGRQSHPVGGKFKGTVTVPTDSDQETVVAAAMELDKVKKAVDGMSVVKTILVKNKLVNLIVKPAK